MDKKPKHDQKIGMTVPMGTIRRFCKKMEKLDDTTPITFEMALIAFFPNAWRNIQKYSSDCYMQGYLDGKKKAEEEKNENQGDN